MARDGEVRQLVRADFDRLEVEKQKLLQAAALDVLDREEGLDQGRPTNVDSPLVLDEQQLAVFFSHDVSSPGSNPFGGSSGGPQD